MAEHCKMVLMSQSVGNLSGRMFGWREKREQLERLPSVVLLDEHPFI